MTICCRICLSKKVHKDVSELQSIPEIDQNHQDVMLFCLQIQVSGDPLISRSLCNKCYKKVISFYIFKLQAIKNDAYLKSQHTKDEDTIIHNQTSVLLKVEEKPEVKIEFDDDDDFLQDQSERDMKEDLNELKLNVKPEYTQDPEKVESDNEVLSVLKTKKENTAKNKNRKADGKRKIYFYPNKNKNRAPKQICEQCGKSYTNLKEHMERHKAPADRKEIQCPKCPKVYNSYNSLRAHNKSKHSNSMKAKCTICDKHYSNVHLHTLRVHDKEQIQFKIECTVCKKRFPNKSAHDHHFLRHTDERPYQCEKCDRKFQTKAILATHMRGFHDKERPFLCHLCSNSYASKRSLQVHLRSHTNELPFTCDECGKRFRSRCIMRDHLVKHTGVKNVSCPVCDKKFYTSKDRYHHMKSHSTEKRFSCQFCGALFKRVDHRARHERKLHGFRRPRPAPVALVVPDHASNDGGGGVRHADTAAGPTVDPTNSGALISISPTPSVM